jgi:tRNA U38,U39,U40 pseudouridine synthase TruA
MEHPLINNIDHLTIDELQTKVNELTKKLSYAQRMGNAFLVNQVRMALETYQNKYREKQQAQWDAAKRNGPDYSDRIDVS